MEKAIAYLHETPTPFPAASVPSSTAVNVTFGDDYGNTGLALNNGNCHIAATVEFFIGQAPTNTANCIKNAVEVPDVRGWTLSSAESLLTGQPLNWNIGYVAAKAGQQLGVVVGESPHTGVLSAYASVKLTLARPLHGVVPDVVGLTLDRARAAFARVHMQPELSSGPSGTVVSQSLPAGVAAAPGLRVMLRLAPKKGG
jgi:hypothetical protein